VEPCWLLTERQCSMGRVGTRRRKAERAAREGLGIVKQLSTIARMGNASTNLEAQYLVVLALVLK
jgi:hypothetical protein